MVEKIEFNGKRVGQIDGETYVTWRKPIHFFGKYQGFGISDDILELLKKRGITSIKIFYLGKRAKEKYIISLDGFIKHGKPYCFEGDDQTICGKKHMDMSIWDGR